MITKVQQFFNNLKKQQKYQTTIKYLSDTSTFKKTLKLGLLYVFLFYLPFTFLILVLNKTVFFQLDHLYQFSTIVFDFRNRVMDFNFSTWDFRNGIGYDYFANFYYIPLDITLLPFFLLPFLPYSHLMWLSFLFKILIGTACFSYLLKLYQLNHKTILFMSVLYGTADLFFAQNVFPSYTGLIIYIPLILIAIELMIQKKNFLIFSLVIFQIFLFNYYWAWNLSLFMALALFGRIIFHYFTKRNILSYKPYLKSAGFLCKSIAFYLLGLGMAAFFFMPTFLGLMQNEPRMELSQNEFHMIFLDIFKTIDLRNSPMINLKIIFKMLVPNLYMYSGFFYDNDANYWLTTNHIIIYSSIMVSFSLFYLIIYPRALVKQKLNNNQLKIFTTLKITTFIATIMMFIPFTSYLFSLNSGPYQRWLIFYGVLLIINLAFIIEYQLFNKSLFLGFLVISCGYIIYSIIFNQKFIAEYIELHEVAPNVFTDSDKGVAITMLIFYITLILIFLILNRNTRLHIVLIMERIIGIGLIFALCVSPDFTRDVKLADSYGKEVNKVMKDLPLDEYYTLIDFLFIDNEKSTNKLQDMAYLYDFPVYNNYNIFHSLINPYFNYYSHDPSRSLNAMNMPYYFYYYTDPKYTIVSNSQTSKIKNAMNDPQSTLIKQKNIDRFDSYISIYEHETEFSLGNGFTTFYDLKFPAHFDYLWLDSLYVKDELIINLLKENGFEHTTNTYHSARESVNSAIFPPRKLPHLDADLNEYYINVEKEDADVVMLNNRVSNVFAVDYEGNIQRCFNKFCFVPDTGIKSVLMEGSSGLYILNKAFLQKSSEQIKKYSTYDVKIAKNYITSKVDNDQPIIMTYKVGYAKGWEVYLDGKKVEFFPSYNGQISFIINEAGSHTVELKYETPYLKRGINVSLASFAVFGVLLFIKMRFKNVKIY